MQKLKPIKQDPQQVKRLQVQLDKVKRDLLQKHSQGVKLSAFERKFVNKPLFGEKQLWAFQDWWRYNGADALVTAISWSIAVGYLVFLPIALTAISYDHVIMAKVFACLWVLCAGVSAAASEVEARGQD